MRRGFGGEGDIHDPEAGHIAGRRLDGNGFCCRRRVQRLGDRGPHDLRFAGFQAERQDEDRILGGTSVVEHDLRVVRQQQLSKAEAVKTCVRPVPCDLQPRRLLVRSRRRQQLGVHTGDTSHMAGNGFEVARPLRLLGSVIAAVGPELDRGEEAKNLLLADLHRPADRVMRRGIEARGLDPWPLAEQEAGRLRSLQVLAAAVGDEAGATREIGRGLLQMLGRGVDQHWNAVRSRGCDTILEPQRQVGILGADGRDHRDARTQLLVECLAVADLYHAGTGGADRVVVGEARSLRHHDLGRKAGGVGQAQHPLRIALGHRRGRCGNQRGGAAGGDQGRFRARQLGDAAAGREDQLVQADEAVGAFDHRLGHLGQHQAAAVDGAGATAVDEGPDAEPGIDVIGHAQSPRMRASRKAATSGADPTTRNAVR